MENKLSHQAIKSIEAYYNDLPFKGDDFTRQNDILFFLIQLDLLKWAMDYEINMTMQEDLRSNIEHYIQLHPNVALSSFVSNEKYKNVNTPAPNFSWRRVFDELGYANITHDTL